MKRKHKQYFVYYLKENILIFDVFDYIEEMAADYVDYCFEWEMVKDNIVCEKTKTIKEYIELYILDTLIKMNVTLDKHNSKILCYYQPKKELNEWKGFFKKPENFIKISKNIFKQKLFNFIENKEEISLFQNVNGYFDKIPCLIPSGEDEDFLLKNIKNCGITLDNL